MTCSGCDCAASRPLPSQAESNTLTFDVSAIIIGGTEAGEQFVQTAQTNPDEIGNLGTNLENAGATLDKVSQPL